MCKRIEDIVSALRAAVSGLSPSALSGKDAVTFVRVFAEVERLGAAARTLAAGRVSETRAHHGLGHRTAAQWMSIQTGTTLSSAIASIETANRLAELPATRDAFVAGRLSEVQAHEIASAASADPRAEASLLEAAPAESVKALQNRCREVRAAALADEDSAERIRAGRYLRNWTDRDGAVRLDARLAPDDGAQLMAAVQARAAILQAQARRSGQRERADAYAADALVGMAEGRDGPHAVVHVEVDAAALVRGHTLPGETCRIPGTGPVPVAVARRLAGSGAVKIVERRGVDVTRVTHLGRQISRHLRTALEARDPTCVVPGCDVRTGLEIDHIVPVSEGGFSELSNLCRLCRFHHGQKTHHGWVIGGAPGTWTWQPGRTKGARRSPPARAP